MKTIKRILVTGFPHTGTSILKSKLGEAHNVYEQINEGIFPENTEINNYLQSDKEFFLWKDPVLRGNIVSGGFSQKHTTPYKDDVIVMILRNPYYVFTSQIKRGLNPFTSYEHTYKDYIRAAQIFLDAKQNNYANVYCIKYEDLFQNDFFQIKSIMNKIGLVYDDDVFIKKTKVYTMSKTAKLLDEQPPHGTAEYRIWQMNKSFENFNSNSKIEIPSELQNILKNSDEITKLGYND